MHSSFTPRDDAEEENCISYPNLEVSAFNRTADQTPVDTMNWVSELAFEDLDNDDFEVLSNSSSDGLIHEANGQHIKEDKLKNGSLVSANSILKSMEYMVSIYPKPIQSSTVRPKAAQVITVTNFSDKVAADLKEESQVVEPQEPEIVEQKKKLKRSASKRKTSSRAPSRSSSRKSAKKAPAKPKRRESKADRKKTSASDFENEEDEYKEDEEGETFTKKTKRRNRQWDICYKYFTSQGLGGHRAKSHPGQNKSYQKKLAIRGANSENRKLLRLAQVLYYKEYNDGCKPKDIPRGIIKNLRVKIQQDENLRDSIAEIDYEAFLAKKKKFGVLKSKSQSQKSDS